MNKLFLITWRWLKRDKKRTALTFCSIVLAVYLISFVGVYMSTALSSYRASIMYEEPEHATIWLESFQQAEELNKNAAWESHCVRAYRPYFLTDEFVRRYSSSEDSLFPVIEINGNDIFSFNNGIAGSVMEGDAAGLMGYGSFNLEGEMPSQAHEVAINKTLAARLGGLEIGDTITLTCGAQGGTLYYAEYDDESPYHNDLKRDENGELIYVEDTDGLMLRDIYSHLTDFDGGQAVFENFMSVENGHEPPYTTNNLYNEETGEDYEVPSAYAVLSGDKETYFEYTATITGLTNDGYLGDAAGDILFSVEDSDILPLFEGKKISYYLRAKTGIDAEEAIKKALVGIGMDDDPRNYYLNAELLILEGRQLEYLHNVAEMFALAAIVLWLFVFLARLIINNAFEISAAYRTEQYGALKTVGASDKQIFTMIMFECGLYMLTALPLGFFGAVAVGKLLLKKVQEIGVFDPIYGEGVSERFFTLELSPMVMLITFGCAMFSIFFSSYADAMRVRRMPPIQSVGYGSQKKVKNKRGLWLSRRLFGYPRGFAIKCISKQKVRFTVTLLSAIMSGIFIMSFAGAAKLYTDTHDNYIDHTHDINVYASFFSHGEYGLTDMYKDYDTLVESGLFEDILPDTYIYIHNGDGLEGNDANDKYFSEDYKFLYEQYKLNDMPYYSGLLIKPVTREIYEKSVKSDLSYDEFAASGKALLCNTLGEIYYSDMDNLYWRKKGIAVKDSYSLSEGELMDVLDTKLYNTEDIDYLEFAGEYSSFNGPQNITERVEICGLYETDNPDLVVRGSHLVALLPFESFPTDKFESQKLESSYDGLISASFSLNVKEGCITQARSLVKGIFGDSGINDNYTQKAYNSNTMKALRIAGFGFGISLAVVVLLNIFSTTSANMINRRRDFSMMRSCGMSLKQVRKSLFAEARIYAVITTIVSSILGWILAGFIYNLFFGKYEFDFTIVVLNSKHFPWLASILVFVVIMAVMASAILPALAMMKRQNIAEEIRTDI